MRKRAFCFLMLICFGLQHKCGFAQAVMEQYTESHFTDENGLPQNSVKNIAADSKGYIWMTTEDGLVRYDGQRFYTFNKSNFGLNGNRFGVIQPSLNGREKGSEVFYAIADRQTYVRINNGRPEIDSAYHHENFLRISFVKENYLATQIATGLPLYFDIQLTPRRYVIPVSGERGSFYVCTQKNVRYYTNWKISWEVKFALSAYWNLFTIGSDLYLLNREGKIGRISPESVPEGTKLTGDINLSPLYSSDLPNIRIYWNHANSLVYLYLGKDLYLLEKEPSGELVTKLLVHDIDLDKRNIRCMYFDKQTEILFLGSMTEGLFILRKRSFETISSSGNAQDNNFYGQAPFGINEVLTPNGHILGKNTRNQRKPDRIMPALEELNDKDTRSMLIDHAGFIWIKSGNFLRKFDGKSEKVANNWNLGDEIKAIYQDQERKIWIGTKLKGLYQIDPSLLKPEPKLFLAPPFKDVSYIQSLTGRRLLVGTEHGLYIVDVISKKVTAIAGTEGSFIKSIYAQDSNQIWFTVVGKGLLLLSNGRVTTFPMDQNKYLSSAHCVIEDQHGFLWLPTNKGLFKIQKKDLLLYANENRTNDTPNKGHDIFYQYFDKSEGFNTNEFNGGCEPCAVRLPNGSISLPSLKGLVWFVPELTNKPTPTGSMVLDKVEHSRGELNVKNNKVSLPLDTKQVRFYFSTPYFGHADNLRLSYTLSEDDDASKVEEWIPIRSGDLSIPFSALNYGDYTLFIRKMSGFGPNNYVLSKILIHVPRHWYETLGARFVFGALILLMIFLYVRFRLDRIKRKNLLLEATIAERTNDLHIALANLEASKNELTQQYQIISRILASITHDVQSPMKFIADASQEAGRMIEAGNTGFAAKILQRLTGSSQNVNNLIGGLLDYVKAYVYGKRLKPESVHIKLLIEKKIEAFAGLIEKKNNQVINNLPEGLILPSDYQMLSIIVQNLIDNAIKYTKNGVIRFDHQKEDSHIHLIISNNGLPLPAQLIDFFNEESPPNTDHGLEQKAGLGFLIIKEMASLNQIGLKVTQTQTTNFYLIFKDV